MKEREKSVQNDGRLKKKKEELKESKKKHLT